MKTETVTALQAARVERRAVVLATRLSDASETLIYPDRAEGTLATDAALLAAAHRAMEIGRSETVDLGGQKIFLNVYVPPARLIIVGAVHIAQSLAPMASLMDFDVTVIDPRRAFATDNRFPGVKVMQEWADEAFEKMGLDSSTAVLRHLRAKAVLPFRPPRSFSGFLASLEMRAQTGIQTPPRIGFKAQALKIGTPTKEVFAKKRGSNVN
jgi:xanthine/CO dehydrogenase XdhC/CoxF family maturation factor